MLPMHGLGGGSDLPIPASFAIAGGTAALVLSFVVLLVAWREPRLDLPRGWRPVPGRLARVADSRGLAIGLRAAGLVVLGFTGWAATAGPDLLTNPTFGIVYVWLWVGLVPASLAFGRFFRAVSPARTLHLLLARALRTPPDRGVYRYPEGLGYWPAAVGLFAFVWMELVNPSATYLDTVILWFTTYLVAMLLGGAVFGDRWLERADPFEVYSTLVAHLSPWGRDDGGSLVLLSPLRHLARLRPGPGLVAVVAVLLGSTAWDSFRESSTWVRFVQSNDVDQTLLDTGMLLLAVVVVGATYSVATWSIGPRRLVHSIVPIIVGYMTAHYLTFLLEVGQQTIAQVSDPLGTGADLFGTADWVVNYWLSRHPTLLASIKVLAIVVGHVLGVVAAHDRAVGLLPRRHQVIGQLPLLAAMVLYTYAGLYLLFGA
jgi:hypothetical protein